MTALVVRLFEEGDRLTVHLAGELDIVSAPQLTAHASAASSVRDLRLDLTGLSFLDVRGAAGLEQLLASAKAGGARVTITGVSASQHRLLSLLGLAAHVAS